VDWINLAPDEDQWRVLVNIDNLSGFPKDNKFPHCEGRLFFIELISTGNKILII
jgi:hypothetical protein